LALYLERVRSSEELGRSNPPSLRVLRRSVSGFEILVAEVAHESHLIVFHELRSLVAFAQEELLTRSAPSLQIGGVTAVLYKTYDLVTCVEHVATNDRRRSLPVRALDQERRQPGFV
jgi:hypothetical protein